MHIHRSKMWLHFIYYQQGASSFILATCINFGVELEPLTCSFTEFESLLVTLLVFLINIGSEPPYPLVSLLEFLVDSDQNIRWYVALTFSLACLSFSFTDFSKVWICFSVNKSTKYNHICRISLFSLSISYFLTPFVSLQLTFAISNFRWIFTYSQWHSFFSYKNWDILILNKGFLFSNCLMLCV